MPAAGQLTPTQENLKAEFIVSKAWFLVICDVVWRFPLVACGLHLIPSSQESSYPSHTPMSLAVAGNIIPLPPQF